MKVTQVEARCLQLPIKFPFTESPRKEALLLVEVRTDNGLWGAGISRNKERFAVRELINREIAPFLLGKDPLNTEQIWQDAGWDMNQSYKYKGGSISRAVGAIDQALWDLKGKYLNQPVYVLLGGASPDSVGAYTTFGFNVYTQEELVDLARKLVREHHDPLKLQIVASNRGQDISVDVARIRAVREAIGDGPRLIVDCNSWFDLKTARKFLKRIEPYDILCVDDPVYNKDFRLMSELRRSTTIPLAARGAGENMWDNREMILANAVDVLQVNVVDGGGFTECMKIAHAAEMFHLQVATGGGWYLQNAHLIAGMANGWLTEFHLLRERIYEVLYVQPPVARNGRLPMPNKPGLGLELNRAAVAEYTER